MKTRYLFVLVSASIFVVGIGGVWQIVHDTDREQSRMKNTTIVPSDLEEEYTVIRSSRENLQVVQRESFIARVRTAFLEEQDRQIKEEVKENKEEKTFIETEITESTIAVYPTESVSFLSTTTVSSTESVQYETINIQATTT